MNNMRDSDIYIAISIKDSEINKNLRYKIEHTFKDLFRNNAKKISDVKDSSNGETEIIYEINTPVVQENHITKEFYENLEVLLYELIDFNPHFTQFRRVDK